MNTVSIDYNQFHELIKVLKNICTALDDSNEIQNKLNNTTQKFNDLLEEHNSKLEEELDGSIKLDKAIKKELEELNKPVEG